MACSCGSEASAACSSPNLIQNLARYRRVLWVALLLNAAMFGVELVAGWRAGSLSLLADAIDFAGDALNYGVSLAVLAAALVLGSAMTWLGLAEAAPGTRADTPGSQP